MPGLYAAARQAMKLVGLAFGWFESNRWPVTVFTLHRVRPDPSGEMQISPAAARRLLLTIAAHFDVIDGDRFLAEAGKVSGRRRALITVDDAFDDAYSELFPIAKELGMPFVLFVPTRFLEEPSQAPVSYSFTPHDHRPCSFDQLREMAESGLVTLGAHSHGHEEVTELDVLGLQQDCRRHAAVFEREGLPAPRLYAYPRGVFDLTSARELSHFYKAGFAGAPHHHLSGELAAMAIPRVPLRGSDAGLVGRLKARGWRSAEERLIAAARRFARSVRS